MTGEELMMKEVSRKNAYLLLLKRKLFVLSTKRNESELDSINTEIEAHETVDKVNVTISKINRLKTDIKIERKCRIILNRQKEK